MKKIGLISTIIALVLTWNACNKDTDISTLLGKMSAKIDGTAWSVSATELSNGVGGVAALESSGKFLVTGTSTDGKTLAILINGNSTGKDYDLAPLEGETGAATIYRTSADADSSNTYYSVSGTVRLTSVEDNRISGTFSFVAAKNTTDKVNITEGVFENVLYTQVDSLTNR